MSILVVWASPNQDGLTSAAKDNILKGLSEAGGEAEALHLNKRDIRCCRACGNGWGLCRSEGRCVINDDFSEDYQRLVSAEAIVWITPVYWHDLAENLKAFLDRLRRCETRQIGRASWSPVPEGRAEGRYNALTALRTHWAIWILLRSTACRLSVLTASTCSRPCLARGVPLRRI